MHYWLVMPAAGAGRRFGGAQPQAARAAGRAARCWNCALALFLADARCRGIGAGAGARTIRERARLAARLRSRGARRRRRRASAAIRCCAASRALAGA